MTTRIRKLFNLIILLSFFTLTNCSSDNNSTKTEYLNTEMQSVINTYIENSVDDFSQKIEESGGFFMWKNYRDYLGFGNEGFKQRIRRTWNEVYDNETLELYINTNLAKKSKDLHIKLNREKTFIDNYTYTLFLPFLSFAFDEFIRCLIVYILITTIVVPYIAKKTVKKTYKTGNFWKDLGLNLIISPIEHKQRVDNKVAARKKSINTFVIYFLIIFTLFFYDFSESINRSLKEKIKKDLFIDIISQIDKNSVKLK